MAVRVQDYKLVTHIGSQQPFVSPIALKTRSCTAVIEHYSQ